MAQRPRDTPPPYQPPLAEKSPPALTQFLYLLMRDLITPRYLDTILAEIRSAPSTAFAIPELGELASRIGRELVYVEEVKPAQRAD